jgi:hypothetical protein
MIAKDRCARRKADGPEDGLVGVRWPVDVILPNKPTVAAQVAAQSRLEELTGGENKATIVVSWQWSVVGGGRVVSGQ